LEETQRKSILPRLQVRRPVHKILRRLLCTHSNCLQVVTGLSSQRESSSDGQRRCSTDDHLSDRSPSAVSVVDVDVRSRLREEPLVEKLERSWGAAFPQDCLDERHHVCWRSLCSLSRERERKMLLVLGKKFFVERRKKKFNTHLNFDRSTIAEKINLFRGSLLPRIGRISIFFRDPCNLLASHCEQR